MTRGWFRCRLINLAHVPKLGGGYFQICSFDLPVLQWFEIRDLLQPRYRIAGSATVIIVYKIILHANLRILVKFNSNAKTEALGAIDQTYSRPISQERI